MSRLLVNRYHAEVEKIIQYGGSRNEGSLSSAFQNLLNEYCKPLDYVLVTQLELKTAFNTTVRPDGTVKDAIRMAIGYWESKDQYDNLERAVENKFAQGYPDDNIIFENSKTAVLYQNKRKVLQIPMQDDEALDHTLAQFVHYERPEVRDFRAAIGSFKENISEVIEALRGTIQDQEETNENFRQRRGQFWEICKESINPEISPFDIQEMLIQHILTEDIFLNIFDEQHFHQENNIASELHKVVSTFFKGDIKRSTLGRIKHYYAVIKRTAASIANHHEKQKFLKVIYENFYKAYNPKAADRLGIVYTPSEIVRFMIESANHLTYKYFDKLLADHGVEILDPATGTGTFITELIEFLPANKLEYKYKNEIHCNEIAILPYYVANLNIELTYKQKMGKYEEFQNICFVDTLDHTSFEKKQMDLFAVSTENTERIKRQNDKTISVIAGNPPYNANQHNFSQNNANRLYNSVDQRIKATYIEHGTAQNQTGVYDMYTRFLRWASDRLGKNGVIAFISNNSFIDSKTYDGFRKVVAQEFSELYIIDMKGNARTSGEQRRREGGNVFSDEIRVGIAVYFLIRVDRSEGFQIHYDSIHDYAKSEEKKYYFIGKKFNDINFTRIKADEKGNWINLTDNNFDDFLPLIDKKVKAGTSDKAIFKLFSSGIKTQRDEWVFDFSQAFLVKRIEYLVHVYQDRLNNSKRREFDIKWDQELEKYLSRKINKEFNEKQIVPSMYRPYVKMFLYYDKHFNGVTYQIPHLFRDSTTKNPIIAVTNHTQIPFLVQALDCIPEVAVGGRTGQCLPLYRYEADGTRIDNITEWGINQFRDHYKKLLIQAEDIFHYVYAVLHHPAYCTKYEFNLKRDFPRISFYDDFEQWSDWGKQLMDLHINFEEADPYDLERVGQGMIDQSHAVLQTSLFGGEPDIQAARRSDPKCKLKADKVAGKIELDSVTSLQGIPAIAWEYKLGNRSALEWILDQYKEKKPKDPTIAAMFNTYRFADYKEHVIDLLQKVCTVSVQTMEIINQMPKE